MEDTIPFVDQLLDRARMLRQLGRNADAAALWKQLARFGELAPEAKEEVHLRLAERALSRRRYRAARSHARRALATGLGSARGHFLAGLAWREGPNADLERAAESFQRSLDIAPWQVRCRSEAGLLALRRGQEETGLALLREAVLRDTQGMTAMTRLVKGLCQLGRSDEAKHEVQMALFRAPRCPQLLKLRADLEMKFLQRYRVDKIPAENSAVVLKFPTAENGSIRKDAGEPLAGPHVLRLATRRRWRRAP